MAAGATDGLSEERPADRVDLFVDHVHFQLLLVLLFQVSVTNCQKCGADQLPAFFFERGGGHQITGNLLSHELVERPVVIERLDDIVAVSPGILDDKTTKRE